ncbi:TAXI family TRAP transporter solute-binding subunit [Cytobacillus kochii]|uniref:TAXI family TRAP transporter solute-binding subunit n=1 Tax=Cytobacillus kochii TaxID=859143 RepID=UPI0027887D7F|nr:TAXI family TRAP transporter solute-binding subunit [Cytobacillus kochii]MDQ0185336.1 TRAP transporter TAXI family solute receptor [Cytobacillus kochii]
MFKLTIKGISSVCLIILSIGFLAACTGNASGEGDGTKQLKIVTATTTGAYYPIGGVMASILSEMDGYNFTAEASGGSQENARLIDSEQAEIGFLGADSSYGAYNGVEAFKGNEIKLAGLAQIFSMPFHIVVMKDSDIHTIEDLKGKSVAVGAPGSGTSGKAKIILEEFGLTFGKNIKEQYLNFKEGADALIDGNVDAVIISVGMPSGNIQELATSHNIDLIPLADKEIKQLIGNHPYFKEAVIPAGTYKGVEKDVTVVSVPTDIVVAPDLDEDLIYEITKMLYETNYEKFIGSHSSMKESTLEVAPHMSIPLHPGAEKFYKEKGVLN